VLSPSNADLIPWLPRPGCHVAGIQEIIEAAKIKAKGIFDRPPVLTAGVLKNNFTFAVKGNTTGKDRPATVELVVQGRPNTSGDQSIKVWSGVGMHNYYQGTFA
jgi:hypothetical protein